MRVAMRRGLRTFAAPAPIRMSTRSSRWLATLALAACLLSPAAARAQGATPARPTLIVFLTVDQMRSDYVDRWRGQLTGGLARLAQHGAFFTNAFQDHAVTETAPGHSVTMSGRFPRSTGILRNTAGVEDPQAPLVTSRDLPASPYRFRGSVLMDWLRNRDARSRALSISRKDRGAILPTGRAKQNVFWYATSNGEFTTSRVPQRTAGQAWNLLKPASAYAEPDSVSAENNGRNFTFPHIQPADTARAAADLPTTPWMDPFTLDAALAGLQALQLGTGPQTDILAVSLSATDYIGPAMAPTHASSTTTSCGSTVRWGCSSIRFTSFATRARSSSRSRRIMASHRIPTSRRGGRVDGPRCSTISRRRPPA
jgi:hypothetical protein